MERCAFLYTLVTDAPISFPHPFILSLIRVHKSSSTAHALFFPIFIHRILSHLDLIEFPTSEPIHIVRPIGVGFLRQRAAHLKASSKRSRIELSGVAPPPPSSTGDATAEELVDHADDAAATAPVPPSLTSDYSDIQRMLETVMTIQAAHG